MNKKINKKTKKKKQVVNKMTFTWKAPAKPTVTFLKDTPLSEFEKIVEERIEKTKHLMLVKAKEYVRNNDRFHNFNRTAEMNRETPTRALHGMLSKHLVSYLDILDDIDKGKMPSEEIVNEKFGDIIVYFHLQEALIKTKIDKNKEDINSLIRKIEQNKNDKR